MSTITKERLQRLIRAIDSGSYDEEEIVGWVNSDEIMELARIALASLEAEAVAYMYKDNLHADARFSLHTRFGNWSQEDINEYEITEIPLYTAPPAPLTLPDEVIVFLNHLEDVLPDEAFNLIDVKTWNNVSMLSRPDVYRAAMLQGAEPVTTAYKLRDAVETIRNSGIEINAEKIFAERDALNAPDCWCRTCRPITLTDLRFVVCPECGNKRCPHANDHRHACTGSNEPGQEGSAYPAAPKQEVKP